MFLYTALKGLVGNTASASTPAEIAANESSPVAAADAAADDDIPPNFGGVPHEDTPPAARPKRAAAKKAEVQRQVKMDEYFARKAQRAWAKENDHAESSSSPTVNTSSKGSTTDPIITNAIASSTVAASVHSATSTATIITTATVDTAATPAGTPAGTPALDTSTYTNTTSTNNTTTSTAAVNNGDRDDNLSEYEMLRKKRIARNNKRLHELGLDHQPIPQKPEKKTRRKRQPTNNDTAPVKREHLPRLAKKPDLNYTEKMLDEAIKNDVDEGAQAGAMKKRKVDPKIEFEEEDESKKRRLGYNKDQMNEFHRRRSLSIPVEKKVTERKLPQYLENTTFRGKKIAEYSIEDVKQFTNKDVEKMNHVYIICGFLKIIGGKTAGNVAEVRERLLDYIATGYGE